MRCIGFLLGVYWDLQAFILHFIQGSPTVSLEVRHEWVGQQHNKATSLATHSKMFGVAGPWGRVVPSSPQARPMFIDIERPLVNVGMSLRSSGGQVCCRSRELLSTVVIHLRQKRKASKLTLMDSVLSVLCLFTLLVVGGVEMNPGPPNNASVRDIIYFTIYIIICCWCFSIV